HRNQACIDGADVQGSDGQHAGGMVAGLLEVAEEEGAVAVHGPAEAGSVLALGERVFFDSQRVLSVEALVAQEAVGLAVKVVVAGAGDDADDAAGAAAELGDAARGNDLEFLYDFLAVEGAGEVGGVVVGRETVDYEVVVQVALSGDRDSLSGNG